ncbi:DUF2087 domain-containing protein [Chloroflexi bacterium TSY]|nr:DUF2087 domain-containing protein [Chloroflexi bacterium TSY]
MPLSRVADRQTPEKISLTERPGNSRVRTEPIQRSEVLSPINALADETRLRILELLAAYGEQTTHEITNRLDIRRSFVVRHLKQLRKARFITEGQAEGTDTRYLINRARIGEVARTLTQLLSTENAQMILEDVRLKLPTTLRPYLNREGLVTNWPTEKKEYIVLEYLITKFTPSEQYTEKQVNTLLAAWHIRQDTCYLRRRLVDFGLLTRTADGARYWRVE